MPKSLVSCNSLLSSLLERRRDAFIVHLAPNHRLLYELAVNPPVSSTQMHQGHGRSLGPVPSTHLQKPPWEDASPSHPAKACKTARQASGERPIWIASAHACRGKCDRASTDEWSPTKASGSALTYSEAGLFLDDMVPDMSDQWCPAYFKRFKLQIGNILKETCSLPDGDRHDVEP